MENPNGEVREEVWPSASQWRNLLASFEAGTLPKSQWTHAAHLTVGATYLYRLGMDQAMDRMRERIRFYNESVGTVNSSTSGYHESLTRMWLLVLDRLLIAFPLMDELSFVQLSVTRYRNRRDLHKHLYSFDVVASTLARREWISPDLAPLEGLLR